jgi:hypothetical protein
MFQVSEGIHDMASRNNDQGFDVSIHFEFTGKIIFWRGPSPFYFVAMPDDDSRDLKEVSANFTYGWGVIPVKVRIGNTEYKTSLFPKDGRYLVPIKAVVRTAENIAEDDEVTIQMEVGR